jgi:NAD(P)-dependent dehydrogenase (short-subunit alcohol dehydrogenase family)
LNRTAVIAGAGGTTGPEFCRALRDRSWRVVALGRDAARLAAELGPVADEVIEVELTSAESVGDGMARIGHIDTLIYNAGKLSLAPLLETTPEAFESSWRVNALGAFLCAHALAQQMIQRKHGSMIFIGATASVRGGARAHAFASAKHALRGLAASLAKEMGPRGVHVAHLLIDGKVRGERTRQRFPDVDNNQCLEPEAVATAVCSLIEQHRSAWTFEMDLRPDVERWS